MKAVGLKRHLPITDVESLIDLDLPQPVPGARDIIVKVEAVSVNPVDTKRRHPKDLSGSDVPELASKGPRVLGFDAAGTVQSGGQRCHAVQTR